LKYAWAIMACLITIPATASAEVKLGGSVYLGYGNNRADGSEGTTAVGSLTFEDSVPLGAATFFYHGELILRSDRDDLSYLRDEPYEVEFGLDFGRGGKLSVSTYPRCGALPNNWPDGDLNDSGNVAVHPRLPPEFRCIGGDINIMKAGGRAVDTDVYLKYSNSVGPLGVEIYADPWQSYNGWQGEDARSIINSTGPGTGDMPPQAEVELSYATPLGIFKAGLNDLGDKTAKYILPIPSAGLTMVLDHQNRDTSGNHVINVAVIDWQTKDHPWFRGIWGIYLKDSRDENAVLGLNFGQDKWSLGIGADADGDWALEGGVKLSENIELVAGADSGYGPGDGMDFKVFPPDAATPRGKAWEIGLRMVF